VGIAIFRLRATMVSIKIWKEAMCVDNFLVALGVVFPMLVMMSVGALLRHRDLLDRQTARRMDAVNFRVFLPSLLFINIYRSDFSQDFRPGMVAFVVAGFFLTLAAVLVAVPRLVKDPRRVSVICQAIIRCNFVIFGISVTEHIYGEGNVGAAALLSAIVVPLVNVTCVILLESLRPGGGRTTAKQLLCRLAKNPLLIASALALALAFSGIRLPAMVQDVVTTLSRVASPVAFVMLGATLSLDGFLRNRRSLFWTVLTRMVVVPLLAMPLAALLGFRGVELAAMMAFFCSPTAVSSFTMAQQMGADGELAAQLVALTSVMSLFTIFICTYVFQAMGFL